jgi:hypothetical protein
LIRLDKRGRRIGFNWWREYNSALLLDATLVWERQCENSCYGYATEMMEYAVDHPRPTLKAFLLANAGMSTQPTTESEAA